MTQIDPFTCLKYCLNRCRVELFIAICLGVPFSGQSVDHYIVSVSVLVLTRHSIQIWPGSQISWVSKNLATTKKGWEPLV